MPSEKFNPNYPNPEEVKKAEEHLTPAMMRGIPREEMLEELRACGEQLSGLSEEEVEEAIRTARYEEGKEDENEKLSFLLKKKHITMEVSLDLSINGMSVNGRELDEDSISKFEQKYGKFYREFVILMSQESTSTRLVETEQKEYERKQKAILEKDLAELGV